MGQETDETVCLGSERQSVVCPGGSGFAQLYARDVDVGLGAT
jgi:hypothetical protein